MTRRLGLNRVIEKFMAGSRYEDRFGPAFVSEIRAGDIVWDVGANVGLYTSEFSEAAGPDGRVVAFEPTSSCFQELKTKFSDNERVVLKNMAIGDADGVVTMALEEDPLAATHRIVPGGQSDASNLVEVEVKTGDSIAGADSELFPNVIKIDVEGHEGAVIDGMSTLIGDKRLHCIGIEVHFRLLEERGESGRPRHIEKLLRGAGFNIRWTDPSHLLATR